MNNKVKLNNFTKIDFIDFMNSFAKDLMLTFLVLFFGLIMLSGKVSSKTHISLLIHILFASLISVILIFILINTINQNKSTNKIYTYNILYKIANNQFKFDSILSFKDIVFVLGLSYLILLFDSWIIKKPIILNHNDLNCFIVFTSFVSLFGLPVINSKIDGYIKLSINEIILLYNEIEINNKILSKTENLHRKQGFILKKQKTKLLKELRSNKNQ